MTLLNLSKLTPSCSTIDLSYGRDSTFIKSTNLWHYWCSECITRTQRSENPVGVLREIRLLKKWSDVERKSRCKYPLIFSSSHYESMLEVIWNWLPKRIPSSNLKMSYFIRFINFIKSTFSLCVNIYFT